MSPPQPLSPMVLCSLYVPLSSALCPLYGPLFLYGPPSSLWPSVSSTFICPPLKPYVPSLTLSPPPQYSVLSMALCPLYGPLPPMALSFLYSTLFPLRPSILSMTLCFLNSPLSSLLLSVSSSALIPSMALCPL
jgi:hypothetical protein